MTWRNQSQRLAYIICCSLSLWTVVIENSIFLNIMNLKKCVFLILKSNSCPCRETDTEQVRRVQCRLTSAPRFWHRPPAFRKLPRFHGICLVCISCIILGQVICIQVQPGDPNASSPSPSSSSLLWPITKGTISCFVFFCLCLLILPPLRSGLLWGKFSKRSPSAIHLKVQRLKKKAGPSQSPPILPYQPEVPLETQGSYHPLLPRLQWRAPNWSSCLLSSRMPPNIYP